MSALRTAQAEFLQDFAQLVLRAHELGFEVTAGELQRTVASQKAHVAAGASLTMNSLHLQKLAGDLNFFLNGVYTCDVETLRPLGKYWESLHPLNSWGGMGRKLKDAPHFSRGLTKPEWARMT